MLTEKRVRKVNWEALNTALDASLKLAAVAGIVLVVSALKFCSDTDLDSRVAWIENRLKHAGIKNLNLGLMEIQFAEPEISNAQWIAGELQKLSLDPSIPAGTRDHLRNLASDAGGYAATLSDRKDKNIARLQDAATAPADAPASEGWIYLGRRSSSGSWAPPAETVSVAVADGAPLKGASVKVKKATVLLEGDPDVEASPGAGKAPAGPLRLVRADQRLVIQDAKSSPTIGSGTLWWGRVKLEPEQLVEVNH